VTVAELITAVRTATRFDIASPSPVTDTMVTVWVDQEHKRFRRELNVAVPALYKATSSEATIAAGAQTLTKPNDFEKLVRIERKVAERWETIEPAPDTNGGFACYLGFEEVGATYLIWPLAAAAGTYRIVYSKTVTAGYTSIEVPDGFEDVLIERVSGRVKERLQPSEAQMHFQIADRIWQQQMPLLRLRYGRNSRSGFRESSRGE
jgi:hypothetical protein